MFRLKEINKHISPTVLIIAAIIFISISVIVDLTVALDFAQDPIERLKEELSGWQLVRWKVVAELLRELGFAAAIAWVISVAIERAARERDAENAEAARKAIAVDVFKAVIGSFVPKTIRDLVLDKVLLTPVTRPTARLGLTLDELKVSGNADQRHIRLELKLEYEVKNESSAAVPYDVVVFIPKCPTKTLEAHHALRSVAIDQTALTPDQIAHGAKEIPDTDGELRFKWRRTIPPQGSLSVVTRAEYVKERSDNEIWISIIPTSRFELTVNLQIANLSWGVDPHHEGELKQIGERARLGETHFVATSALLPYQGTLIWWRPTET